jgi:hypothetical protein
LKDFHPILAKYCINPINKPHINSINWDYVLDLNVPSQITEALAAGEEDILGVDKDSFHWYTFLDEITVMFEHVKSSISVYVRGWRETLSSASYAKDHNRNILFELRYISRYFKGLTQKDYKNLLNERRFIDSHIEIVPGVEDRANETFNQNFILLLIKSYKTIKRRYVSTKEKDPDYLIQFLRENTDCVRPVIGMVFNLFKDNSSLKDNNFSISYQISKSRVKHNYWMNLGLSEYLHFISKIFNSEKYSALIHSYIESPHAYSRNGLAKTYTLEKLISFLMQICCDMFKYLIEKPRTNYSWWSVFKRWNTI